ncbi:MAG: DUF2934 domain-containing protein [Acidobacteriaceae bacterium]|nr:DUF2934 domain-containing protein [Acidobacteriaceae bacterium]
MDKLATGTTRDIDASHETDTPLTAPRTGSAPESQFAQPAAPHQDIAIRAHALWIARGCPIGSPEVDWHQAEEELRREVQAPPAQVDETGDSA